ncbi:hypothetical protein [Deinococcus sp.]|uniref:hypothetical protein n=1 Tax=Deinococcus sp. TaxID=47478 RepID=UPI003C7C4CCE
MNPTRTQPFPRGFTALLVLLSMLLAALLTSAARAGSCQGVACITAGPRLAQIDSTQSPLLNALLGGLTGSSINMNVADWNGLNNSNVNLGLFLNALQARTSTGSTTAALNAQATLAQFLGAAADAAQQSGDAAAVNSIGVLTSGLGASALNQTARIGDFLKLGFNQGAFSASKLNLFNLVTGGVQLFNSQNTVTTASNPISLGAVSVDLSALGIAGLGATTPTVTLYAQVTEPPVMICGPAGTQFYTASIRVKLNVALNGVNASVPGVPGASLGLTSLQLYLDVARAQGSIGTVNAVSRSLSLQATPGLVNLYLGSIPDSTFFNRTHSLTPADLDYARIGQVAATVTVPVVGSLPVNVDVEAKASGNGSYPLGTLSFAGLYPQSQKVGSSSAAVPVLVDDLLQNLSTRLSLSAGQVIPPAFSTVVNTLIGSLQAPVKALSGTLIRPIAVTVLRATVDRVLSLLGIGIGQAEVTVLGVNTSCLLTGNVYRDLEPDGARAAGEVWDGPQLYATLLSGGSASQSAGYLFINPQNGSASTAVTAGSTSIPDLPYGLFYGDRVSGKTYRDDGRGSGGTPNNARQESGEPNLSGVAVTLSSSGGSRGTVTDAGGSYTLYLPGDWTGNTLSTGSGPVTGVYDGSSVTFSGSIGGLNVRPYPLPNPSGTARQAEVGLVQNLTLSAAPAQSSEAPATLRSTHLLRPGTQGTLALSAVSGFGTQIYLDTNCDGVVDASERSAAVSSVTVGATWPRDASGDLKACALELDVTLTAGTASGTVDNALLNAGLTWSGNPAVQDAAAVTDTSTVVPGTVLSKKVSNLTRAPGTESTSAEAFPGDVLRYCLTASNTGPQPASLLVIGDTLKPQVVYQAGTLTLDGAALSDMADTDAGEVVGRDVRVRVPSLASGAQAKVCFQVQVP